MIFLHSICSCILDPATSWDRLAHSTRFLSDFISYYSPYSRPSPTGLPTCLLRFSSACLPLLYATQLTFPFLSLLSASLYLNINPKEMGCLPFFSVIQPEPNTEKVLQTHLLNQLSNQWKKV